MPYRELSVEEIEDWFDIKRDEVPDYLILHCTWPWGSDEVRSYIQKPKRLSIEELGNFWVGKCDNREIGYMKIYGSGMAADMLYILIKLGVRYVFQIGSMGGLQHHIKIFDLVIPSKCIKYEGLNHHFSSNESKCDDDLFNIVKETIEKKEFTDLHTGKTISIDSLFAETTERVGKWSEQGLLAIDMETATTYAVCQENGVKAIAILSIIDNLVRKGELISDKVYQSQKHTERREFVRDIILETINKIAN